MSLQTTINPNGLPSEVQTAYAPVAGTTIPVTTTQIALLNVAPVTMTATPTITTTDITAGTRITILQAALGTLTLQDESVLAGSKLKLAASTRTLSQSQTIVLIWTGAYWSEVSYTASGSAGGSGIIPFNAGIDDPSAVVILPGTGVTGSTTISNTGDVSAAFTAFGNTQIAATPTQWGGGAIYFDGNGDYIVGANNSAFAPLTNDFTYEAWINMSAYGGPWFGDYGSAIFCTRSGAAGDGFLFMVTTTGRLVLYITSEVFRSATSLSLSVWNHVAMVRSSGTVTFYINGVSAGSVSLPASYTGIYMTVGAPTDQRAPDTVLKFNGYMNDFRYSSVARYTSNFAPGPAAAFPPAYNPALLPASPVVGQLALSSYSLYACTNATGPVWKRTPLNTP